MSPVGLPDTFFTAPPHWRWLVILYFFVGGIAGGSYVLAALADTLGEVTDRPLARLGYYVAFPATVLSGIILIFDLGRPLRFWHMLVQSETGWPMFKSWSPMSVGSWMLMAFGGIAFLSFLAALAEARHLPWTWPRRFHPPGVVGWLMAGVGSLLGFFLAGYTGVLLAVTNRPIWADTWLLGLTFMVSATSISAAVLVLLASARGWTSLGVYALRRFETWVLVLELVVLAALVTSLGGVARAWLNAWGLLLVAVVVGGILVPLALHRTRGPRARLAAPLAAVLVLAGGFLLRVVLVLSSEALRYS
jgi:formate-dependent nitrite reductase membrane component NrfD